MSQPQQYHPAPAQPIGFPTAPWGAEPAEITPDTPLDDLLVEYGQTKPLADSYARSAESYTARATELKAAIARAVIREYVGDSLLDEDDPTSGLTSEQRALVNRLRPGTPNYA